MGFVGFKSNEVAKEAASYFNRTYMKMSKISVDLARPVRENCVVGSIFFLSFSRAS
jgi:multiple RNA-binding domain-containing protein 1